MCVALDAAMSGRWCRVFRFLCLVTNFVGYITSKVRGLWGRDLCMLFIWLGGICLWLGDGFDVGAVFFVARRWR